MLSPSPSAPNILLLLFLPPPDGLRLTYALWQVGVAVLRPFRQAVGPAGSAGADDEAVHRLPVQVDGGPPGPLQALVRRRLPPAGRPERLLHCKSRGAVTCLVTPTPLSDPPDAPPPAPPEPATFTDPGGGGGEILPLFSAR